MAQQQVYNPNLSNGTCYYVENTKTKGNFIPCGNDAIQAWPCCMAGSYCLSLGDANACWDAKSGNTYVAGCTDPSFTSPNCLHKPPPFHDQEWVAINQACKNLNSNSATNNVTNWTGCRWDDSSVDLVKLPLSSCTPYCSQEHVLYAGSSSLTAYGSLPVLSGSSIFWQNNFVPPATPSAGYTPGTPTGVVGTFTPTATAPVSVDNLGGSGLSTAAKVGIGVGAGLGGVMLIAILISLLVCCVRRREREREQPPAQLDTTQPMPTAPGFGFPQEQYAQGMAYAPASSPKPFNTAAYHAMPTNELDTNQAPAAFSGYKTELPADELLSVPYQPVAPGSSPPLSAVSTALGSSPSTGAASRYSHRVSPQFADNVGDTQGYGQPIGQPGQPYYQDGGMAPISELHGWRGGGARSP